MILYAFVMACFDTETLSPGKGASFREDTPVQSENLLMLLVLLLCHTLSICGDRCPDVHGKAVGAHHVKVLSS